MAKGNSSILILFLGIVIGGVVVYFFLQPISGVKQQPKSSVQKESNGRPAVEVNQGMEDRGQGKEQQQSLPPVISPPSFGPSSQQSPTPFIQKNINGFITSIAGDRFLRVVAPNGGEKLCLGSNFVIHWESGGLNRVRLFIRDASGSKDLRFDTPTLGSMPASSNPANLENGVGIIDWKVGQSVPGVKEGLNYEFVITDEDNLGIVDTSDNVFSITKCDK